MPLLRASVLGSLLLVVPLTMLSPPVVSSVQAKKKGHKKNIRKGGKKSKKATIRKIRKEGSLSPKKELNLDADVSKTKDLKPTATATSRPTLTAEELEKQEFEELLDDKLDEEITLTKDLLQFESGCEGTSPVRFRMADLFWEKSKRAFFKSNDFNSSEKARKRQQGLMKELQDLTVKHYREIVEGCPGYTDYPKVLYYLGKTLMELERPQEGTKYLKEIIQDHPDSPWIANAWFMVGEFYFNVENDAHRALKAYKKAAEQKDSPVYGFAVYKQGWCYVNTGDWDLAMDRFRDVIGISEDPSQPLDQRGRLSLRKEALKDYVRAFSNIGDAKRAYADFKKVGGTASVAKMMEQLGSWYINRDAHADTILVYRDLIKHFPRSTRLPVFQGRIVDAASRLGDDPQTVADVHKLTKYFIEVRKRIEKGDLTEEEKATVDKDLQEAEDIAENTLRRLALDYHKAAKELRGKAQDRKYEYAHDLYKHYLEVFPKPKPNADVNYVFFMRYYFAEVLFNLERFAEAAANYDIVVDMNPQPKDKREKDIVVQAAEDAVRAYDEVVQDYDRVNKFTISGQKPKPIPEIKQKLIESCQRYIKYAGAKGSKLVEIRYKVARIYYSYNHFEEAAPAFNDIVENHPEHEVACYSANLALDIYNGAKDYAVVRKAARAYKNSKRLACGEEDREKFRKIEEQATFLLIKTLEEKKQYVAAGNAYMNFYRQYGKEKGGASSSYAADAVYNAAVNYDLGQRLDKANEVREFLVKTFDPNKDVVIETLFNIAQSYERVVDFAKAAKWYEDFAEKYPKDKRTRDAIYNAGLYRATLRDFDGAKVARQKYLSLYPKSKDAHEVLFALCESVEREAELLESRKKPGAVKKWNEAHDCYLGFVKNRDYSRREADLLCHAQFRRGEIMHQHTHYEKGYGEMRSYILKNWPSWKKKGIAKLPQCSTDVAELKFRDLREEHQAYSKMRISELNPAKKKVFETSVANKVRARTALIEGYKEVVQIGVAEWALASLYMIGEAYRDSIEALLNAPIPNKIPGYKLTDEDKELLRQQLRDMVVPIEELAVEAYRICVDKANELGVYNRWSGKALSQLQKLRPEEYRPAIERLADVSFAPPLVVAKNGPLIKDGEDLKEVERPLAKTDSRKKTEKKGKKASKKSAPEKEAEQEAAGGDVPEPVNDGVPANEQGS
ncbi:MAG: tetratricopeptide repeat protein [Myxococcota bacterium]